ncbi:MAG: FtsX-like permease family protein [Acidimicrobiaceae bacterium]|nr:FtsX-like permease family protein [Acidimicrobiaceae bacterium]
MLTIALRGIAGNPFRYAATALAIVLGIAFFTATSVMTTSFEDSLNDSIAEAFVDVDVAVRSAEIIETPIIDIRERIPPSVADEIAEVDGVAWVFPFLAGYAQVVAADGKTVGGADANAQAIAWIDDDEVNPLTVVAGRAPVAPDEVVIDVNTFDDGGFSLGDSVQVLPLGPQQRFDVVGAIDDGGTFGGQVLSLSFAGAATVFGGSEVDQIFAGAAAGITPDQLAERLNLRIGADLEAVTGATLTDEFQEVVGTFTNIIEIALQVFAGVALFVGAFVIYNTFTITVAQRTREMALLRAIGATGRQVAVSVVVESAAIGVVASAVGAAAGIGIGWGLLQLLGSFIGDLGLSLSVPAGGLIQGVVLGTVITVAAAYIPARRGARVDPIEAMRDAAAEPGGPARGRLYGGLSVLAAGAGATAWSSVSGEERILYAGLPLVVIAVVLLGPTIVRPISRLLAAPAVRRGSITGELASENASRNPKRSSTTSLTLMIGVALVVTATVFAATLSELIAGDLEEELLADHVVTVSDAVAGAGGGLDPAIAASIGGLGGVDAAVGTRTAFAQVGDGFAPVSGADTARLAAVADLGVVAGTVSGLGPDEVAVREPTARDEGLNIGDTVDMRFQQGASTVTVAGIFDGGYQLVGEWLVDNSSLDASLSRSLDTRILVSADDADQALIASISAALAGDPTAKISTRQEFIDDQAGQITDLLTLLYALLGMSVVVALIGIVNTMSLSIHERTRELGLLRAVGMTTRQLRRTVRYEAAIIALIGTLAGLVLGLFFGWAAFDALGLAYSDFAIPWAALIAIGAAGLVAGLLSGVLPARRAGRLEVLDAIATQ